MTTPHNYTVASVTLCLIKV